MTEMSQDVYCPACDYAAPIRKLAMKIVRITYSDGDL